MTDETQQQPNQDDNDFSTFVPEVPPPVTTPQLPLEIQIKNAAYDQIVKFYPEYRQLNTLMEGDQTAIAIMKTFIQAVRDWSNGPNPDFSVVKTIVPQVQE